MKHLRRTVGVISTAALLSLIAAGCRAPEAEPEGSEGSGGGTPEAADEIIIAYPSDIDTIDPHQFRSIAAYGVVGNIYGTLLQEEYTDAVDGVHQYTGKSTPYVAESATWNDDQTALTLTLRSDAKFADGSPITADDVVYSLRRALSDVGYASAVGSWLNVSDAEADIVAADESTVEISVTHYSPLIEKFLTFQIFPIVDSETAAAEATDDDPWAAEFFAQEATESGPYVIESRVEGQSLTLAKNEEFTASDLSQSPNRIVVQHMPDPQQAFLALQNGAVDLVSGLTPDLAQAVEQDENLRLYDLPYSDIVYLGMNNDDPALSDVRVRQAISYLMPYETLREEVMLGYSGAAYGAAPYPMFDALDDTGEKVAYPTDPAAAKALLDEAGIGEGELELTLSVPATEPTLRQSAVFIQSALEEAGIKVTVNEMSEADFNSNLGKLQLYVDSWYSWGQDSVYQLFFLLKTGLFTNYTNFSNKDVDKLIEQAMATTDPEERTRLSHEAQEIVIEQAPWAFLYTRNMLLGAQANVTGITHSDDANLRFDRLRIEE